MNSSVKIGETISFEGIKIKLLGDSITHGVGGTGFVQSGAHIAANFCRNPDGFCWAKLFKDYVEEKYGSTVINNACTGTRVEFVIDHFNELVSDDDDLIICTIGTNNRHVYKHEVESKPTREAFGKRLFENILKMNEMFAATGKKYILVANIPASAENEHDKDEFWRILHMNDINEIYARASEKAGFNFVSMYELFSEHLDANGIAIDSLLCDGLHPNDEGYKVMFKLWCKVFEI